MLSEFSEKESPKSVPAKSSAGTHFQQPMFSARISEAGERERRNFYRIKFLLISKKDVPLREHPFWFCRRQAAKYLEKLLGRLRFPFVAVNILLFLDVLAIALVLSIFGLMGTSCTACTNDGEMDSTGTESSTILTTETTTPITGPDGTSDAASDTASGETEKGTTTESRTEENTTRTEDTSALRGRLF